MCGIAGFSLGAGSEVNRTLAAQALLAGIAERGADAVGYAYRTEAGMTVHKQQTGPSALFDSIALPQSASEALVHVRDYTKGHPTILANNHPIRHGRVVGIHNGIIANDDEVLARHGLERAEEGMTVDSEAIFALAEQSSSRAAALEELHGSMAAAWMDERETDRLYVARGMGRPLWIGQGEHELFFASTRRALELFERYTGLRLRMREVGEGTLYAVSRGRPLRADHFEPDRSFVEERVLPPVRAPEEARFCLARLASIVTAAAAR